MPSKTEINRKMQLLADALGYEVRDISHLSDAMYCKKEAGHSNYTNDAMATLGDAVLKLIWSEHFYSLGLDKDDITARKADMENNGTLKNLCDILSVRDFAYNDEYFADQAPAHRQLPYRSHDFYLEAIIAAIYLDRGLAYTAEWVLDFWGKHPDAVVHISSR